MIAVIGVASAWGQDPAERGGLTAVTVSIANDRLKVDFSQGFTSPDVSVDYDALEDEWVASDPALLAGPGCLATSGQVRCAENGEDVLVDFNDTPGEVTLAPAGDGLDFDSRVRLGFNNQSIVTSNGDDVVTSNETTGASTIGDEISTLGGTDKIQGGLSPDLVYGGPGNDTINGNGGDDILEGGAPGSTGPDGSDSISGGDGVDLVSYSTRTDNVSATIGGTGGAPGEGDEIAGDVEELTGGLGDDTLKGNESANVLRGGSDGDDVLFGGTGDGPDGADVLRPGGNPTTNVDTVSYANRRDSIVAGIDGTDGADDDDISAEFDNLIGGKGADTLTGSDGANLIVGGRGHDMMFGLDGPDTINALDDGPDTSNCGGGTDVAQTDVAQTEVVTGCESTDSAPETEMTLRPERKITTKRARFRFESSTGGVTGFECSFDRSAFAPCASPQVVRQLSLGRHRFAVRAIDADGDADISPAKATFKRVKR